MRASQPVRGGSLGIIHIDDDKLANELYAQEVSVFSHEGPPFGSDKSGAPYHYHLRWPYSKVIRPLR